MAAVLTSLGVREPRTAERPLDRPSSRDPLTRLVDSLRDSHCLLVLDNCEHLIDGRRPARRPAAGPLPARCASWPPAASRSGSSARRCASCRRSALPPAGRRRAEAALAFPAVRLFADRAAAVRAGLRRSTTTTSADVVEIVRRLDGLPLAIELAAARLRALPVREIAARLVRPVPAAHRRQPHRHAAAPDAARGRRVELGPAHRRGAACWPSGSRSSPAAPPRPAAEAVCAGGRLAGGRRSPTCWPRWSTSRCCSVGDEARAALPDARDDPGVRHRAAGRAGRGRPRSGSAHAALLRRSSPRGRAAPARPPSSSTWFAELDRRARQHAWPRCGSSATPATPTPRSSSRVDLGWYWMLRGQHAERPPGWLSTPRPCRAATDPQLRRARRGLPGAQRAVERRRRRRRRRATRAARLSELARPARELPVRRGRRADAARCCSSIRRDARRTTTTASSRCSTGARADLTRGRVRDPGMFRAAIAENDGDVDRHARGYRGGAGRTSASSASGGGWRDAPPRLRRSSLDGDLDGAPATAYAEAVDLMRRARCALRGRRTCGCGWPSLRVRRGDSTAARARMASGHRRRAAALRLADRRAVRHAVLAEHRRDPGDLGRAAALRAAEVARRSSLGRALPPAVTAALIAGHHRAMLDADDGDLDAARAARLRGLRGRRRQPGHADRGHGRRGRRRSRRTRTRGRRRATAAGILGAAPACAARDDHDRSRVSTGCAEHARGARSAAGPPSRPLRRRPGAARRDASPRRCRSRVRQSSATTGLAQARRR